MKRILILATSCMILFACSNDKKDEPKTGENTMSSDGSKALPQSEFADAKYTEIGKKMNAQLQSGDIDGWLNNYAENAVYTWSAGDSLAGKKAITDYWKNRRMNVIDSISISNDIWLPIKVNTPQKGPDIPGVWLMVWSQTDVKYKKGGKLTFWVHNLHHFDANDKIDRTLSFVDFAPINKALGK